VLICVEEEEDEDGNLNFVWYEIDSVASGEAMPGDTWEGHAPIEFMRFPY
jgi:hypothetical protein